MAFSNILIVKLSAIGDVVHVLPVPHALKQCLPQARVTWVVEKPAYDLLANNPDIDEIIVFDKARYKSLAGLAANAPDFISSLRRRHFDLALDLQGLFKSAIIAFLSGAKTRLVYENTREGSQLLSRRIVGEFSRGHVVDRYLDVVRALGCQAENPVFQIVITEDEAKRARAVMEHAGLKPHIPYIVLAIGANWPNKIWPAERFALLADRIYDAGMVPVIAGGPGDNYLVERLLPAARIPPVNLVGKTTLKQLAYLIRHAGAFAGGDTGPMHLSAALGTPTVALMGPTDAVRNGPYGNGHKAVIVRRTCAGCWQRQCPQHEDCLAEISVDEVLAAIKQIMIRKFYPSNAD
ncbi:MAG TPA: glycosyltransferase family 9 protein [Methylomusa anaerophila]|uniref:Lipopolysaccharide core heptosyltransferase RfaQ n=1 Tax=Methylomusa anaerophila TaxID=1930071 RepID=A0A348AKJ8_9FIRM|nr:glycosyltransferase family 9 protein [Methylomusa anaerophila]BBB91596.1 lipopolysaccharide core heptosyltransferase RfaQ [Methylomusa anaerophila]HML89466.1 glycosyltransferase family 9 protein [Methylomusa anaerophila]